MYGRDDGGGGGAARPQVRQVRRRPVREPRLTYTTLVVIVSLPVSARRTTAMGVEWLLAP